jgi:hypothetical protein
MTTESNTPKWLRGLEYAEAYFPMEGRKQVTIKTTWPGVSISVIAGPRRYSSPAALAVWDEYKEVELAIVDMSKGEWSCLHPSRVGLAPGLARQFEPGRRPVAGWLPVALVREVVESIDRSVQYKELRAEGHFPERALSEARHSARWKRKRRQDYGDWRIEFADYDGNSGLYGGYRCRTSEGLPPWLERAAREAGWDPAHLSLRITADIYLCDESLDAQIRNMGYDLVRAEGVYSTRSWKGEYDFDPYDMNRPEPHSVLVDLSGPRDRPNRHWLTYVDKLWNVPTGMSKSTRRQWEHERRVYHAEHMAEWARKCVGDCPDIQPYHIFVEIMWRGDLVGAASCGGFEAEWRGAFDGGPTFEEQILEGASDLFDEAWRDAQDWAESAVEDAKAKAAEIVESIALLPEAAHRAVRDEFARKVITMNAKKEA